MTELLGRPGGMPGPETAELCLDPRFRKVRLRPDEASDYLLETHGITIAVATLAKWRCIKSDGPAYQHSGRFVLYRRAALDEWAEMHLGDERRSTSDDGGDR